MPDTDPAFPASVAVTHTSSSSPSPLLSPSSSSSPASTPTATTPTPPPPPTPAPSLPSSTSMTTPAPVLVSTSHRAPSPPPAPSKPPAPVQTPMALRAAPELAEFDPFATPVPAPVHAPSSPRRPTNRPLLAPVRVPSPSVPSPSPSPQPAARLVSTPRTGTPGPSTPRRSGDSGRPSTTASAPGTDPGSSSARGEAEAVNGDPAFNFSGFLKDLRVKSAEPIARYLKSFLTNFAKKPFTVNEQIKLIRDFLAFISEKMSAVEPWKSQSAVEFDNALEAMEKLVMNRLYPYTFTPQLATTSPITTDDLERDAVFAQRVRLFTWVREKHLDVPDTEAAQGFLGFAEQELLKINHYKAPRDKMICVLNCCKVIFGLIRHTLGAENTSADAFVPILIFVVLRASPESMLSNVEYINRFRNPEKLQGEAGYYLSSLTGAIAFIETMDASSLSNITQEEFELNVEHAIQALPVSPTSPRRRSPLDGTNVSESDISPFATSPGEEPARALTLPNTALDGTRRFFQRTGDVAKEAVSRPLGAIGKILETMQREASGATRGTDAGDYEEEGKSEDGDEGGDVVDRWAPGGVRDRQAEARAGLYASASPSAPRAIPSSQRNNNLAPQTPSRLLAQLGLSPGDSRAGSEGGTPRGTTPDFAAQLQHTLEQSQETYARGQARSASVHTLHQMFPDLDEDVADAVLESCADDLGLAIDRLLEM